MTTITIETIICEHQLREILSDPLKEGCVKIEFITSKNDENHFFLSSEDPWELYEAGKRIGMMELSIESLKHHLAA